MIYTVNLNGRPVRNFTDEVEARKFMLAFQQEQVLQEQKLSYIDAAVDLSDLSEANTIIKHIMELPNGLH
jgi:hypothetical protein